MQGFQRPTARRSPGVPGRGCICGDYSLRSETTGRPGDGIDEDDARPLGFNEVSTDYRFQPNTR